jgi:anti-sigma B factor antagonist
MEITQRAINARTRVIGLGGPLNAGSSDELKEVFHQVAGEGIHQVVVDLGKVHFIDSSGLAALVSGLKALGGENARLKLAGLQPQAQLLFKLTMFDRVFETYADVDTALKACQ